MNQSMSMVNILKEITFQTTRSGGKGGQNVNKVETAVIGSFDIAASATLTPEQKILVKDKLNNRINSEGVLLVRSQAHRTQLSNKEEVIRKMNELVNKALMKKTARIATRVSKASKQKRLESKKRKSEIKAGRQRVKPGNH